MSRCPHCGAAFSQRHPLPLCIGWEYVAALVPMSFWAGVARGVRLTWPAHLVFWIWWYWAHR